jgi:hypothetical protein
VDVYARVASLEPTVHSRKQRIFAAYAAEVARVDSNGDGVLTAVEADLDDTVGGQPHDRLFLPTIAFNRFAVTRELTDGLPSPRLAPSERAWVQSGCLTLLQHSVDASIPKDADNR